MNMLELCANNLARLILDAEKRRLNALVSRLASQLDVVCSDIASRQVKDTKSQAWCTARDNAFDAAFAAAKAFK